MIRTKDIRIISDMFNYARKRKHSGKYTVVSFLSENKNIVSRGINIPNKTHAKTPQIEDHIITTHAEIHCVSKYIVKRKPITKNMTLYVVGLTKGCVDNFVISSKPCDSCLKFIEMVGVRRIVYVENCENVINFREMILEE